MRRRSYRLPAAATKLGFVDAPGWNVVVPARSGERRRRVGGDAGTDGVFIVRFPGARRPDPPLGPPDRPA
jgi:hypothetical protein